MKIRLLLAVAGLAIGFALPTFAQQPTAPDPKLREQILACGKQFDDAFVTGDAAALAVLFTEDAIFVTDTGPVKGRQAIEKYWLDQFDQFHHGNEIVTVDADSPHIIGTAGNEMWATGGWSMAIQGKDWGPKDIKGYWSVIREGEDWKIRMLTSNVTPAPAK